MRASTVVLVALVACGGASPPKSEPVAAPTVPVEIASVAPPPIADAGVTAIEERDAAPSVDAFEIVPAASGTFAGASGNVPGDSGITGLWGSGDLVLAVGSGFLFRSTDRGLHFTRAALDVRFPVVWGPSKDEIYAGGEGRIARSTDGGITWSTTPIDGAVQAIWGRSAGEIYVAGGGPPFVAKSTDHGASWSKLSVPVKSGWLYDLGSTGPGDLLVSGKGDGGAVILRSTDAGKKWTRLPAFRTDGEAGQCRKICFSSGVLFAASSYALHMTRDLGKTWTRATDVGAEVLALACRGSDVVVGGRNRALLVSRDLGASWTRDPLGALFTDKALVSAQAAFLSEGGEAYVGFEGLYDRHRGSVFRRSR